MTTQINNNLQQPVMGKNIVITGGTTGIGRATALLLASQGAKVLLAGLDQAHLNDTLNDAQQQGLSENINGIIADLATEKGVKTLFNETDTLLGKPDILINNAALAFQSVADGSYADWQKVINTNVLGYLACAGEAIDRMKENGGGHIVNIGSMSADVREKDSSVYVATKSAIQGFSEALRKEVNELGIKVTLIEPGAVGTDMQPVSVPDQKKNIENLEMMKAEDIAAAILYAVTQPMRCEVVDIKIKPHLQII